MSCIMTMPQYQRQGYGRFLIDFSMYRFSCDAISLALMSVHTLVDPIENLTN